MQVERRELEELGGFALALARRAGDITLKYFQQSPAVDSKADGSFVTIADREAEAFLRQTISEKYPEDGILGEEEGELSGSTGRRWIIDPIDGTFSFVHGVPFYGVLVGLEIDGEAIVGAVNFPALKELIYAIKGLGCYFQGALAHVSKTPKMDQALLLATDFGTCNEFDFGRAAGELQQKAKARRTWGDCYGHVLVATGRADVMLDPVMNIWDCAALLPIVSEAGGTFTDWNGTQTIAGGNAISTNGILFEEVMGIVKE
jgi:histidinol phosphatase-like enzyme (inositol monophosphatase family)